MLSMPRIVRPDLSGIIRTEFGSPVEPATHRSIKRNKELRKLLIGNFGRQANQDTVFTSSAVKSATRHFDFLTPH